MIAIALPIMLLLACGGGGSSGGATAVTPTTPMTDNPNTPPTTGDPNTTPPDNTLVTLPAYVITDVSSTRTRFSGTAPTITSRTNIVNAIQTRATAANTLIGGNIVTGEARGGTSTDISATCSGKSCSATLSGDDAITFSLSDVESISPIDDTNLSGFNTEIRSIMVDDGITLVESLIGAQQGDGVELLFQSYGGWLTESVFGVDRITVPISGGGTSFQIFPYSFGNNSGSNPTGTQRAVWRGVAIARKIVGGALRQGDVEIDIDDFTSPNVDVSITNMLGINRGSFAESKSFTNIPLNNGTFEMRDSDDYIHGSFYGSAHTEVGGVFRDENAGLVGAFGGTKQ